MTVQKVFDSRQSEASVAVILAFFNGAKWIEAQLESIKNQVQKNIDVYIFDDCSDDSESTKLREIVKKYSIVKKVTLRNQRLGYAKNFLTGLQSVSNEYSYYCFSDQDDIWLPTKLSRAINYLKKFENQAGALYGARTLLCDADANIIRPSKYFERKPSLENAIVQNIFGGNTIVFDPILKQRITELNFDEVVSHDWMLYQVATGCGASVIYDACPTVLYRQTNQNAIGVASGYFSRYRSSFLRLANGKLKQAIDIQINILLTNNFLFLDKHLASLRAFQAARRGSFYARLSFLIRHKIFRQGRAENILFLLAFLIGKV